MLIKYTNTVMYTEQQLICVSRPRRFEKYMAANMLTAYYSHGRDSREMFQNLKISQSKDFEKHLNKYNVIHINMQEFLSESDSMEEMLDFIDEDFTDELKNEYPDIRYPKRQNLIKVITAIFSQTNIPFVFVIDEWSCIFRVHKNDLESQKKYFDFLHNLLTAIPL